MCWSQRKSFTIAYVPRMVWVSEHAPMSSLSWVTLFLNSCIHLNLLLTILLPPGCTSHGKLSLLMLKLEGTPHSTMSYHGITFQMVPRGRFLRHNPHRGLSKISITPMRLAFFQVTEMLSIDYEHRMVLVSAHIQHLQQCNSMRHPRRWISHRWT